MSQHIIAVRCEIQGLYVKKTGTYAKGATWSIDTVPEALIQKVIEEKNSVVIAGKKMKMVSFITPTGGAVDLEEAYMPRFNKGNSPVEAEVYESSKKTRKNVESDQEVSNSSEENISEKPDKKPLVLSAKDKIKK